MPTATQQRYTSIGGLSLQGTITRTGEGQISQEVVLPVAEGGTLTTRTSDTAGTITMDSAGHTISTGDKIDIFWTDANGDLQVAYGATVGTVAGTSVPFTGASGTVLPAQDYDVTVDEQVEIDVDFDGDNVKLIELVSTRKGRFQFQDTTPTILKQDKLRRDDEPWGWASDMGISNPLTGNPVDKLILTQADETYTATVRLGVLYDSTP